MATRDRRRLVPPAGVVVGVRRGLALALLTLVAFIGGVATTQLWPVHTETDYFAADVSVAPTLSSAVELPMVVGDVVMTFDGPLPAPGLRAQVSVREEVTDLLRSGRLDASSLQPSQEELREAIDDGVAEVGWKFASGALVTSLLVLLTYAVARPHHLGKVVLAATSATVVALVGPGAAAYLTYRVDNVAEFRATSLLSLVQTNTRLLDNLASNATHGAVYRPDTGECAGGPCRGGLEPPGLVGVGTRHVLETPTKPHWGLFLEPWSNGPAEDRRIRDPDVGQRDRGVVGGHVEGPHPLLDLESVGGVGDEEAGDAALGGHGMRARGKDLGDHRGVVAGLRELQGRPEAGAPAADDDAVER